MQAFVARFFQSGGPLMWLILAMLAVAVAVIAERLHFYLVVCRDDADSSGDGTVRALNADEPAARWRTVGRRRSARSTPSWARRGTLIARPRAAGVRQAVEETAIREVPRYGAGWATWPAAPTSPPCRLARHHLRPPAAFSSLALTDATEKAAVLAAGIAQAMNTTAFGLLIAIPCLAAHASGRPAGAADRGLDAGGAAPAQLP